MQKLPAGLARQDRLDVLAVAAGWKPVALLGADGDAWPPSLPKTLAGLGLACESGPPWRIVGQWDGLPDWYRRGVEDAMQALALLYVTDAARPGSSPPPGATIAATDEARALAYPACCVTAHHARQARLHALCAQQIERRTRDLEMRVRLAGALLPPLSNNETERDALGAATEVDFAPMTPVAQCADCAKMSDSPAAALSASYAKLASQARL